MAGFAEPSVESTGSEIDDNNALFLISTLPFPSLLPIEDREGSNRDESTGLLLTYRYPPILVSASRLTDVMLDADMETAPLIVVTKGSESVSVGVVPIDSDGSSTNRHDPLASEHATPGVLHVHPRYESQATKQVLCI
jgi:hypothetical protein